METDRPNIIPFPRLAEGTISTPDKLNVGINFFESSIEQSLDLDEFIDIYMSGFIAEASDAGYDVNDPSFIKDVERMKAKLQKLVSHVKHPLNDLISKE